MIELEYTEDWVGESEVWETVIIGKTEREVLQKLIEYVNQEDAIAGIFRIKP